MNNSAILSAEQLVAAHARTSYELPASGLKEVHPTGSWLEGKQVQSALDQRKALLENQRVEKLSNLMIAEWRQEKHKAEVSQKNKHWDCYGHHSNNSDWLFPEEVLYLMEMNCLECVLEEVPLSVQRGYSLLLQPEHGCSPNEYRVLSLLCRAGYRVVRHLPDLTVTAYERQIRLDRHLDQRKTYSIDDALEPEDPRPDLPPKRLLSLSENTEINISPSSAVVADDGMSSKNRINDGVVSVKKKAIEIIDLADSSSSDDAVSSDDSDIEVIHVSAPSFKHKTESLGQREIKEELEIIEVPVPKKEIIVETIESSDSEREREISDESESEKSDDGNWKRNRLKKKKPFIRPPNMNRLYFLATEEFCVENQKISTEIRPPGMENGPSTSNDDGSNVCGVEVSSEPSPVRLRRPFFPSNKLRNEILDEMPTMGDHKQKLMTLQRPDLRLIPENIKPKQQTYTFNTNTLRARVFSNRPRWRGRGGFGMQRFNSYGSHFNTYPGISPALGQLFGSDVNSMARGMIQFASALLNNQNGGMSYNPAPRMPPLNIPSYAQQNFNSLFDFPRTAPVTPNTFHDNRVTSVSPRMIGHHSVSPGMISERIISPPLQARSFGTDRSNARNFDVDSSHLEAERKFVPPSRTGTPARFSRSSKGRHRPFDGRHYQNRNREPRSFERDRPRKVPEIDPAYIKPDIPLPQIDDESGNFLSLSTNNPIEIISIDDNDDPVVSSTGVSSRFLKRKIQQNRIKQKKIEKRMRMLRKEHDREDDKSQVFIFLDDSVASSSSERTAVKEEDSDDRDVNIKTENTQNISVKPESNENHSNSDVKSEAIVDSTVKTEISENAEDGTAAENDRDVRVKLEQDSVRGDIRIAIKIDSSSDTSSVSSLPISSLVKPEPSCALKSEPDASSAEITSTDIKEEEENMKTESSLEEEVVEKPSITPDTTSSDTLDVNTSVISVEEMKVDVSEASLNVNSEVNECDEDEDMIELDVVGYSEDKTEEREVTAVTSKMEIDLSEDVDSELSTDQMLQQSNETHSFTDPTPEQSNEPQSSTDGTPQERIEPQTSAESNAKNISWAEMKKHNIPLISLEDSEDEESEEEGEEVQPLIKPKHCKTIRTVLSALQIFAPFRPQVAEDVPRIKISFDMYLAADFRKAQRGLPQFRIAVFGGTEPVPSPAQLRELQTRFQDRVPVLRAVVTPGSVVFYSCADVSLPVDLTSYTSTLL